MENFMEEFNVLFDELQQNKNVEENLSKIIRFLKEQFSFQSLGIFLKIPESKKYRLKISRNISHSYAKNTIFDDEDKIIKNLKGFKCLDFKDREGFKFEKDFSHLYVCPLHNNRNFHGFIFIDRAEGVFSEDDILKIKLLSKIVSIVVDLDLLRDQLNHTRNLDEITGFLNYSAFYEKGEEMFVQMKRYNRPMSIIVLKIDDYEKIVRTIGKEGCDSMIRSVTKSIKENIRGTDILGKLYRDVYAMVMPETDVHKALTVVKRMDELITRLPPMDNSNIGWGLMGQDDRISNLDDLISKAREAALESCRKSVYKYTIYQD
ncbi:GGDEF domain-containing protein [Candidatus Cloacimonadota bacterium]